MLALKPGAPTKPTQPAALKKALDAVRGEGALHGDVADHPAVRGDDQRYHARGQRRLAHRVDPFEARRVRADDDADDPPVGRPRLADLRQRGARLGLGQGHRLGRRGQAQAGGDLGAQHRVDVGQAEQLPLADLPVVAPGELEGVRVDDVLALHRRHAEPEEPRLAVVVVELRAVPFATITAFTRYPRKG